MQTFTEFFRVFHLEWATPILALLIIIGSVGGMINWLIAPAKGLLQAAESEVSAPIFCCEERHQVPVRLLLTMLVSLFCFAVIFMPSVNAFYWFLTNLSTELYMLVYILLFISALKLGRGSNCYRIPKGFRKVICSLGLGGCILTIYVAIPT